MGDKTAQWKGSISVYHFVMQNTHKTVTHYFVENTGEGQEVIYFGGVKGEM